MNLPRMTKWCTLAALTALGTIGLTQRIVAQLAPTAGQDGIEVLTRGPVHEAFAETISFDPAPGLVVPKAPPAPIEELAPDQRPQGANVAWIPGYWAWDDERNDFLWVSGIWRALPPGRQWAPGYWGQSPQGSQWTSGYWADAAATTIDYLPKPPATVEVGPNIAAPSADSFWLPGSWTWQQNRYGWRPGYWANGNQNWDWVPDHYVWTPRGYVFVDGYYDYSAPRRGVVFAPVYFAGRHRDQRGFSYSPSTVINPGVFLSHLFLRPRYGHYYFGDYYGSNYASAGYSPSYSYQSSGRGYDPIYANQRWQNRRDGGWEQRAEANFRNLSDNENARPPRNLAAQAALAGQAETSVGGSVAVAAPLEELVDRKVGQFRFQAVDPAERQQFGRRGQEYRKYLEQRQQLEANAEATPGVDPAAEAAPARRTFSRSPFVGPSADQLGRDLAPPQRHEVLKPEFQDQPQTRFDGRRPGTGPGFRPGTADAPVGQTQVHPQAQPQAQPQRRDVNQGQEAPAAQVEHQDASRGDNRDEASNNQPQGASNDPQPAATNDQPQGDSQGQSQSSSASQEQSAPQDEPAEESK